MQESGQLRYFRRETSRVLRRCWWQFALASALLVGFTAGVNSLCMGTAEFFGFASPAKMFAVRAVFTAAELAVALPYFAGLIRACMPLVGYADTLCKADIGQALFFFGNSVRFCGCIRIYLRMLVRCGARFIPAAAIWAGLKYWPASKWYAGADEIAREGVSVCGSAIFVVFCALGVVSCARHFGVLYLHAAHPGDDASELFRRNADLMKGRRWQILRLLMLYTILGGVSLYTGGIGFALVALPYWAVSYTMYMSFLICGADSHKQPDNLGKEPIPWTKPHSTSPQP